MTTINLIPDDVGVQKLRIENRLPDTAKTVSHVQAGRAIHQTVGPPRQQEVMHAERRRHGERRHSERRKKHSPVILDTRSHHERRSQHGQRQSDKDSPAAQNIVGIDTEV